MKLNMGVIKPFKLDDVREVPPNIGVEGMTASEVKGFGRQEGHVEFYRGAEYTVHFLPKVKLEIAVNNELVESAAETIRTAARGEKIGESNIFVYDIWLVLRIGTGELDTDAL